jgi:CBS domain-containing protein
MLKKLFKKDIRDYKAKDLMTKNVKTLQSHDDLFKAHTMMSKYRIKKIVVTDSKNRQYPVGIITVRDMIKFLMSDTSDRDLYEISVSEAMTKNLLTTNKNDSLVNCAKAFDKNKDKISSLVVVEKDEDAEHDKVSLAGIITSTDFTRFYSENCPGLASVEQYMSHPVYTISISEKLSEATKLMIENHVSQLVVIGAADGGHSNRLLGILTESDIANITPALKSKTLRSVYETMEWLFTSYKRNVHNLEPNLLRIQDILTENFTTVGKEADLAEAATIIVKQGINGIPVIKSASGSEKDVIQPVGIISKPDVVRALTQLDE